MIDGFARDPKIDPPVISIAAKMDMIQALATPQPICCECWSGCRHIVGHTDPIISAEDALLLLGVRK